MVAGVRVLSGLFKGLPLKGLAENVMLVFRVPWAAVVASSHVANPTAIESLS